MKQILKLPSVEALRAWFKRYPLVWIILAAGLCLLAIPSGSDRRSGTVSERVIGTEEEVSVEALEEKLGGILSRIEGAGKVSVMLTIKSGTQRILAKNLETSQTDSEQEQTEEIVVISGESGDEVVLIGRNYPVFQGALVVCPGGDNAQVRLEITRALSALTGLGAGRITVCKGS